MTFWEIAEYLKIKESRLRMTVKKFRDGGYEFHKSDLQYQKKIDHEMETYLLRKDIL
jgi:hypothetical protein